MEYSSHRFGFSDAVNEYQPASFQCTGREAVLTDCTKNSRSSCEADNADFAMAVRCGGMNGNGGGRGKIVDVRVSYRIFCWWVI